MEPHAATSSAAGAACAALPGPLDGSPSTREASLAAREVPPPPTASTTRTTVVFLTINDVYELFPGANGVGGLAEMATMLAATRAQLPQDARVIVTLNGDFLWRSELDRKDKGAHMVELLNYLQIEYVVLGNHEFDFGAETMRELLVDARFTCFGSNVRCAEDGALFPGLVDICVVTLRNGLKLGLFGLLTTVTGKDPFAGPSVTFDDELPHARRCVEQLQTQGADAIVALTHFKVAEDERLAMQAPGIHLLLGGHDHEPMTRVVGHETLLHKSGMDALWLGVVEMTLTTTWSSEGGRIHATAPVQVDFQWRMLLNRGYRADVGCLAILSKYARHVEQEEKAQGKLEPLGTALTALDGRRVTCRTKESNLGNLVADALREGLSADVGLVNAGYIKGDQLNAPGLVITRKWLEKYLPLVKPTVVVELRLSELKSALTYWLRRYPAMSSSHPHFSGLRVVYDVSQPDASVISELRLIQEGQDNDEQQVEGEDMQRLVAVAMPLLSSMDGWHFFENARRLQSGSIVRSLVEEYVRRRGELVYPPVEGRLRVIE